MTKYLVKRFLLMLPTLFGVALVTFLLIRVIPGDVVELRYSGDRGAVSQEKSANVATRRAERDSDADLTRPETGGVRHHTIDANRGHDEGNRGERRQDERAEPRTGHES